MHLSNSERVKPISDEKLKSIILELERQKQKAPKPVVIEKNQDAKKIDDDDGDPPPPPPLRRFPSVSDRSSSPRSPFERSRSAVEEDEERPVEEEYEQEQEPDDYAHEEEQEEEQDAPEEEEEEEPDYNAQSFFIEHKIREIRARCETLCRSLHGDDWEKHVLPEGSSLSSWKQWQSDLEEEQRIQNGVSTLSNWVQSGSIVVEMVGKRITPLADGWAKKVDKELMKKITPEMENVIRSNVTIPVIDMIPKEHFSLINRYSSEFLRHMFNGFTNETESDSDREKRRAQRKAEKRQRRAAQEAKPVVPAPAPAPALTDRQAAARARMARQGHAAPATPA